MNLKCISAVVLSFAIAGPAWAQGEEEGADDLSEILDDGGAAPAEGGEGAEGGEDAGGEAAPVDDKPREKYSKDAFPRLADDEETIYSVQRKAFLVNEKIELSAMFAASFADKFVQTFAPAASISYHIRENFGIELYGAYLFPSESDLTNEIGAEKLRPEVAKLTQMLWGVGLGLQWSPFYGKLEVFGTNLGNFGFYLAAGAGVGQTRVQCLRQRELLDPNQHGDNQFCGDFEDPNAPNPIVYEPNRTQFMGSIGGGFRFYFSDQIGLKFEIKDYIHPTRVFVPNQMGVDRFSDAIRNNLFIQLGLSFLFLGEDS